MKKVEELTGAELDYWTARAQGVPSKRLCFTRLAPDTNPICTKIVNGDYGGELAQFYRPSTDWSQGGPLIDQHRVSATAMVDIYGNPAGWAGDIGGPEICGGQRTLGGTPLQAICRAVVRSVFGEEVGEVLA